MIHYRENCNFKIAHEITGVCKECALFDHYNFMRSLNHNEPVKNPIHQPVIDAIRSGKKWRIQSKPNKECGHPGVRGTGGKCRFCAKIERSAPPKPQLAQSIRDQIAALDRTREELVTMLKACEMGYLTSPGGTGLSMRQAAIQSGHKWYWSDKACNHCGSTDRMVYVANGRCAECGKR